MKKTAIVIIAAVLLSACAPATFLVSKGNRAYYIGSRSKQLNRLLCQSGDMDRVLERTDFPEDIERSLYRYVCTDEGSVEKATSIYLFLTPDEKKELKRAFIKEGYTVNYVPC